MSYVLRTSRADIESGLPGFIPERRPMRMHVGGRPVNNNSMTFLLTGAALWFVLGVFLMATSLRMYATCQQLQAQAEAHAAAASSFLGGTELRLHVPPSVAFATRGRLQSLRLQLALLDREFDDLAIISLFCLFCICLACSHLSCIFNLSDYDALRALDSDNPPDAPSMTEEEINALPVHYYKVQSRQGSATGHLRHDSVPLVYMGDFVFQSCSLLFLFNFMLPFTNHPHFGIWLSLGSGGSLPQQASSSSVSGTEQKRQEGSKLDGDWKTPEDELTCSVCLEQVSVGELIRSLPCLHQVTATATMLD
ncbi:hypothetical protein BHE74_00003477 [Ensete ventricosum]|nr:hypothetical protein BHE74_00003477 [Ensete ventricosum]